MCQTDTLPTVLGAGNLCNTLRGDIACRGKALGCLDSSLTDHSAVLQHILQIDQTAVMHMLCKIIGIVKMDNALLMSMDNVLRQQKTLCDILADLSCHVVALYAVYRWIFVGIFLLNLFVITLQKT